MGPPPPCLEKSDFRPKMVILRSWEFLPCMNFRIFIENGNFGSWEMHFFQKTNFWPDIFHQFSVKIDDFCLKFTLIWFFWTKTSSSDKKGVSNVLTTVYSREGKLFVSIKYRGLEIKYLRIEKFFKIEFFQHSEQDWNWRPPNVFGSQLCLHSSCKQYCL